VALPFVLFALDWNYNLMLPLFSFETAVIGRQRWCYNCSIGRASYLTVNVVILASVIEMFCLKNLFGHRA
jgi:hypothetical protein